MLNDRYELERARLSELNLSAEADLLNPVFGEGNAERPRIMFIGEAPGREEASCGRPFVGKAGRQLDEMLRTAGIDRGEVFVTNAVKYRPFKTKNGRASNRTPSAAEVITGAELLCEEISSVDPIVIATLGQAHGMPIVLKIAGEPRTVFPLYHPAASIYNRSLAPVLQDDLIKLGRYALSVDRK